MKKAKKGQNFLVNPGVAEKIVEKFLPVQGAILEIGPGKGILTGLLIGRRRHNRMIAVEVDEILFARLKERYKEHEGFEILQGDILKTDPGRFFCTGDEMVNVIGNVPYYISKELMDWVIRHRQKIAKGIFMMQKEFVDKLTSGPGSKDYHAQGVLFNGLFRVDRLFDVRPGSFSPPPRVKSTVFLFERKSSLFDNEIDSTDFYRFLRQCFGKRRKTLYNNLAAACDGRLLEEAFVKGRVPAVVRAEQLSLGDFLAIYRIISRAGNPVNRNMIF